MRSFLLLAAAAMGLLCALGKPSESVETPIEPGSFQAWNDAETARLEASQAIHTASAPVKATSREAETPAEPADELEIAPWEEPQPLTLEQFRRLQELLKRNPNATQEEWQAAIDGTEIVVEEPPDESPPAAAACGCGDGCKCYPCSRADGCQCDPCGCADCPMAAASTAGRLPRLRVTVWDKGCTRCEAFKSGAMAELGWTVGGPESQIEIVTVPGNLETSPPAPMFEYVTSGGTESWIGYENRDEFMGRLRRAMGLPFEARAIPASPGVTGDVGRHSHRCSSCGTVWSHDPNSPGFEHYSAHSCPNCGRYENEIYQGGRQPAMQTRGTYYAPSVQRRGFFGRLFSRGGCANGACGR